MKIDLHPLFRFSEFEVSWTLRSLGELYDIDAGYAFKRSDYIDIGIPLINGESIKNGNISNKNLNFLPTDFKEKYKSFILKTNDIVIALNRPIINGSLKISQIPTYLDGSLLYQRAGRVINFSKLDIDFSYQLLTKEVTKFVLKEAVGSDQPFISTTKLKNWLLATPNQLEEQKKIGSFFKNLDDTIALHQQELDALKQIKQGFLQKMFPRAGESIPEFRFPGFPKEWSNYKIADISKVTMGQSPSGKNYTSNPNDHILVQGNADIKKGHVHPRVWTTEVTKIANPGDIILCVRAPVGDVAKTSHKVVLGRGVASIEGNEFLYHLLYKMKTGGYWARYSTGSTFESINSTDIKEAVVMLPSEEEQIKIGEFFRQVDEVLDLKEQELEALKETKKGFLQKMFV